MASILIVEDEPDMRFLERLMLESAGHTVSEAGHGRAALDCIVSAPPDLVVTDVMMPVMNGLEFMRRLRADPRTAPIPILVVSGDADLAGLANAVLAKPFTKDDFLAATAALLPAARHPSAVS